MHKTIPIGFLLLLISCSSNNSKEPQTPSKIIPTPAGNNSPILIADGSSIHFRQPDYWVATEATRIAANLAGHHAVSWVIGPCPADTDNGGIDCLANATHTVFTTNTWNFVLCTGTCTTSSNVAVKVSQGPTLEEVDIDSMVSGNYFRAEPKATNGFSQRLESVHFTNYQLTDGTVGRDTSCGTTAAKPRCVLRIKYCITCS